MTSDMFNKINTDIKDKHELTIKTILSLTKILKP